MLSDNFFPDNEEDSAKLVKLWKDLGSPSLPPEFEDTPAVAMAEHAVATVTTALLAAKRLLQKTMLICILINRAKKNEKPTTAEEIATSAVCLAAMKDPNFFLTVDDLAPKVESLLQRIRDPELTMLELVSIATDVLTIDSSMQKVISWNAKLKKDLDREFAQLN